MKKTSDDQRSGIAGKFPGPEKGRKAELDHRATSLYNLLCDLYGTDRLVLKASKLEALDCIRAQDLSKRVLGLQKLVYEDPTLEEAPGEEDIPAILAEIEEEIAEFISRRSLEDRLEKLIAEKMQEKHEEYVRDIKMQILKENSGPENAHTLKKLAILEKMDQVKLGRSAMEVLRPKSLAEIVGQEQAIASLVSKLASPYPQHIILYGPPGVGKTTAARLALEAAKQVQGSSFGPDAPFVEVNGTTLRWDPRTNPLLGSVHDPIYQGAKKTWRIRGIPEPKLGL